MNGPSPSTSGASRISKAPFRLVLGVSVVLLVGFAYGLGRLQTEGRIRDAQQAVEASSASASAQRALLDKTQKRVAELEARRRMALAQVALDERNFGIAEGHLHAAGVLLAQAASSRELVELGEQLSRARLAASEDLGAERKAIAGWARRFDERVPPVKP
jgi:hypothetical protein